MRVKEICSDHVVTVSAEDTIFDAAKVMRDHHVGDVVVTEQALSGMYPRGILTDRDLVVGVLAQDISDLRSILVKDVMTRELIVANADEDVFEALTRMRRFGIRRMPVVNSLEVLVGIVVFDDVVRALAERLADLSRLSPEQMIQERWRRP